VTYLSSMTKGTQLMADVQDKFAMVHASQEREEGRDRDEGGAGLRGPRQPHMDEFSTPRHGGRSTRAGGREAGGRGAFMDFFGMSS
jgi:hypothetical protein